MLQSQLLLRKVIKQKIAFAQFSPTLNSHYATTNIIPLVGVVDSKNVALHLCGAKNVFGWKYMLFLSKSKPPSQIEYPKVVDSFVFLIY